MHRVPLLLGTALALSACGDAKVGNHRPPSGSADRVYFQQATYTTVESTLQVRLYVARAGTAAASVGYATRLTGSADANDLTEATGTLTWAAGDTTSQMILIYISGDPFVRDVLRRS